MSGAVHAGVEHALLDLGHRRAAASGTFTVTRTISEPASASSMHCCAVAAASAVSVIVIDWHDGGGGSLSRIPGVRAERRSSIEHAAVAVGR